MIAQQRLTKVICSRISVGFFYAKKDGEPLALLQARVSSVPRRTSAVAWVSAAPQQGPPLQPISNGAQASVHPAVL